MKSVTVNYVKEIFEGLMNDDYTSIRKAAYLLSDIASGHKDIDVEENMKSVFKNSLYRKFMRAYTRYIIANPNCIKAIALDCAFNSFKDGENSGIEE